jgi:hypothetical protein
VLVSTHFDFSLYALMHQLFEQTSLLSGSIGIQNPSLTWLRKFFQMRRPERVNYGNEQQMPGLEHEVWK